MQENIKTEFFETRQDGVPLVKTYSVNKKMIKKVGTEDLYDEAIDVGMLNSNNEWVPALYSYEETDKAIETNKED